MDNTMETSDRASLIRSALTATLQPTSLTIQDDSHAHRNHPGAQSGGGHFVVNIVSTKFEGKTAVQRHRMVYEALGDLMQTDIHAVNIIAKTPSET
jgi:BolA protein